MSDATPSEPGILDLLRWVGWAQAKAGEDWIRERDLTQPQGFVLGYLVQRPGAMQRELAETTRTSPANVSGLLQVLERRGLVERRSEPGDDRSKRVYATAAGAELIAGFGEAMTSAQEAILAPLDADDRAALHALLVKITASLPPVTR